MKKFKVISEPGGVYVTGDDNLRILRYVHQDVDKTTNGFIYVLINDPFDGLQNSSFMVDLNELAANMWDLETLKGAIFFYYTQWPDEVIVEIEISETLQAYYKHPESIYSNTTELNRLQDSGPNLFS
jgi:hypothetical protein